MIMTPLSEAYLADDPVSCSQVNTEPADSNECLREWRKGNVLVTLNCRVRPRPDQLRALFATANRHYCARESTWCDDTNIVDLLAW